MNNHDSQIFTFLFMRNSNFLKLLLSNFFLFYKKSLLIRDKIIGFLLSILFGIILGSLFGTFLPTMRMIFPWDGFIFMGIILFGEMITSVTYTLKNQHPIFVFLNWIKIGVYLGFFMDAFKVGS